MPPLFSLAYPMCFIARRCPGISYHFEDPVAWYAFAPSASLHRRNWPTLMGAKIQVYVGNFMVYADGGRGREI